MALGAFAVTLAIAGVALWAARAEAGTAWLANFRQRDGVTMLLAASLVGWIAMAGSLYLSEVADFPPCRLCWYQRIAAYPLGPILLLAWIRRDRGVRPYAWLLSIVGLVISCYHMLVERFPSLESSTCEVDNPCSIRWVEQLGFVTIPTMAAATFVSIAAILWLSGRRDPHGT